jgi:D-alanyl-D-alanine carboxypeptidase
MPQPRVIGTILNSTGTEKYDDYNMSAQVGEGNGYGTIESLNTYIRTLMKGQNVLNHVTIQLMQKDLSPGDRSYALGCTFIKNLDYGHNKARIGYLSLMAYDPANDISVVCMILLWDLRDGINSFLKCFNSIYDAAYAARQALGYSGIP